jgi:hypothetical protein
MRKISLSLTKVWVGLVLGVLVVLPLAYEDAAMDTMKGGAGGLNYLER